MKPNGWGDINGRSITVGEQPGVFTPWGKLGNNLSCKVHRQNCMVSYLNSLVSKPYVFTFSDVLE